MKRTLNKKGFTLIELMVVMAIIAVLSVLIISAINAARNAATDTTRRSNGKSIQVALEAYYAAQPTKAYPTTARSGITALTDINTDLASYLNPALTDPQTGPGGIGRYCYAISRSGYVLGITMGNAGGTPTCTAGSPGTVTGGESFSINP